MTLLKLAWSFLVAVLSLVWRAVVVTTPLLGVWLASSLIAWSGGPREVAVVGGVLLFPLLPLAWEAVGARRFRRREASAKAKGRDAPRRFLTTLDRLVLRTLVINGLFIGGLLATFPRPAFTALATRGDWFLDGRDDDVANVAREGVYAAASWLEWLHELANPNPYKKEGDDLPVPDDVKPVDETKDPTPKDPTPKDPTPKDPTPKDPTPKDPTPKDPTPKDPTPKDPTPDAGTWRVGDTFWPHEERLHPVVASMPASVETSIASVATYIATREADPFARTKALHDWVVSRLHYDHDSVTGVRKGQDAETVFANRMGVCEGYARLLVELGKFAGVPIVYVVGEVREADGRAAPVGHAWNAAQIKGQWYFIDATWDDPTIAGGGDAYQTDYLFTPPSVAIFDHLPDDPRWQLLKEPLDRGAFVRQRMARPGFAKLGLELVSPERPIVDATGDVIDVVIKNPRRLHLILTATPEGAADGAECSLDEGDTLRARCPLPQAGRADVLVFASATKFGTYTSIARLVVHRR